MLWVFMTSKQELNITLINPNSFKLMTDTLGTKMQVKCYQEVPQDFNSLSELLLLVN